MGADNSNYLISNIPLTEKEFTQFQKMIYEWAGIHMSESKKALISGRLLKRLRFYQFHSYQEYIDFILDPKNTEEKQIMVNLLTTNETYFFRESQHLDYLRDKILPQHKGNETFRIWSAASSSGQEAYSIGMILQDSDLNGNWEIIGTDINETVLEKAVIGIYPLEASEKIPENFLKKYCLRGVRSQYGTFTVVDEIKSRIHFIKMNLNEPFKNIGLFNLVFLRNVMIYFDQETKIALVDRIYNVIKPSGYLILGHSENLNNISKKFKTLAPTIYQKIE
ncbi:MAG: protein-glutamate O-methyltransferase CheR [Spirochaetia bacterium]|nr:protein-glutamate O-methyltransferase CheR [Spirochaetia bacterium]